MVDSYRARLIAKNSAIGCDGLNAYQRRDRVIEILEQMGIHGEVNPDWDSEGTLNALIHIDGRDANVSCLFSQNAMSYGLFETMLCLSEREGELLDVERSDIERWNTLDDFINIIERL